MKALSMKSGLGRSERRGFTLIEIMVVVIVLGVLAAIVIPNLIGRTDDARVTKAQSDISALASQIEMFRLDMRRYPTEEEGLTVLRKEPTGEDAKLWKGPYAKKDIPNDPWGQPYKYYSPAPNEEEDEYGIESLGSDGQPGGKGHAQDLNSWTNNEAEGEEKPA